MDFKTRQHLTLAERNRDLAHRLLHDDVTPPPFEWAVVVAFYAAVHFVNAYVWEARRREPSHHAERAALVRGAPLLRASREEYRRLQQAGYLARYEATFRLPEQRARGLVMGDLATVEATVRGALGLPPPGRPST